MAGGARDCDSPIPLKLGVLMYQKVTARLYALVLKPEIAFVSS